MLETAENAGNVEALPADQERGHWMSVHKQKTKAVCVCMRKQKH